MFDPYHKWLGIPPKDHPPNHYRLLGLELFESDVDVIEAAANRQMAYVQQRATGEHLAISQKLLNELSAARVCLLDSEKKAAYDVELKSRDSRSSPVISPPPQDPTGQDPTGQDSTGQDPTGIEGLFAEEREQLLHKAQQAYNEQDYQQVIKLLGIRQFGDDPCLDDLMKAAQFALNEIQRLSQELDHAWKQHDIDCLTQVAREILAIQASHLAANEAIRWVDGGWYSPKPLLPVLDGRSNAVGEWFFRKYFLWAVLVFFVAFSLGSLLVYRQIAASKGNHEASQRAVESPSTETTGPPNEVARPEGDRTASAAIEKPAIFNVKIDPPNAILTVQDNKGVVTGSGGERQIRIDHPSTTGRVVIEAACDGYKSSEQWLIPKPGTVELQIRLERLP